MKILISLLVLTSLNTQAGELCSRLLVEAPTPQQIEQTIESLARLKMTLDLEKRTGTEDRQRKLFEQKYIEKKQELLRDLKMTESELNKKLRGYIRLAQKEKDQEQDQTHRDKKVQAKAIAEAKPDYSLSQRWTIRRLDGGVLSPNGENLFTISTNPNEVHGIKLATGDITVTRYDSVLTLGDRLLILKDRKWSSLETNDMKLTELAADLPSNMDYITMRASSDKDTALFFPGTMSNGPKDRFRYQLFDANGKQIDTGDVYTGFTVMAVPFMGDQYWVLQSGAHLFKFFPQSKLIEPLAESVSSVFAIPGTNKIIANQDKGLMSLIDLDTKHIESRTFNMFARPFFANKDLIWVSERDKSADAHFHLIKISDFSKSEEPLADQPNFVLHEIPGTEWFAFHNQYFNSATQPGIYHVSDLNVPLFTYNGTYDPGTTTQIHHQWVSQNGKRIVTTVLRKGADQPVVDIWEKKTNE